MTADLLAKLAVLDPHGVRAYVVKIISVDTTAGTCTIDPNDGEQATEVPYWGGPPPVGSIQVALLFDTTLGVITAGSGGALDQGWLPLSCIANWYGRYRLLAGSQVAIEISSANGPTLGSGGTWAPLASPLPANLRPGVPPYSGTIGTAAVWRFGAYFGAASGRYNGVAWVAEDGTVGVSQFSGQACTSCHLATVYPIG